MMITKEDETARQFTVALIHNWFNTFPDKEQADDAIKMTCYIYQELSMQLSKMNSAAGRGANVRFLD